MEPELPQLLHTGLNGSALVGLLASWSLVNHPVTPPSPIEGLASWLDWKVAIPLSAALQVPLGNAASAACAPATPLADQALEREFTHVRGVLGRAIDHETSRQVMDSAIDSLVAGVKR